MITHLCVYLSQDETTKEEPDCLKCPPKEEEPLNIQNSLTPNHENNKEAGEDNAEEVNSLKNMNV